MILEQCKQSIVSQFYIPVSIRYSESRIPCRVVPWPLVLGHTSTLLPCTEKRYCGHTSLATQSVMICIDVVSQIISAGCRRDKFWTSLLTEDVKWGPHTEMFFRRAFITCEGANDVSSVKYFYPTDELRSMCEDKHLARKVDGFMLLWGGWCKRIWAWRDKSPFSRLRVDEEPAGDSNFEHEKRNFNGFFMILSGSKRHLFVRLF